MSAGRPVTALVVAVAALLLVGAGAPGEELPAPDDYDVPLSTFEVEKVVTYPLSTYTVFAAEVGQSSREQLLEAFDAEEGEDGTVLTMPDRVLFDFDSAELRDTAADRLQRLLVLLEDSGDAPIAVHGHTDDVGSREYNQTLSEDRADAVADYLVDAGVDADRITTEGFADTQPVEPNQAEDGSDNPEGRQANRRVEVVVELDG